MDRARIMGKKGSYRITSALPTTRPELSDGRAFRAPDKAAGVGGVMLICIRRRDNSTRRRKYEACGDCCCGMPRFNGVLEGSETGVPDIVPINLIIIGQHKNR